MAALRLRAAIMAGLAGAACRPPAEAPSPAAAEPANSVLQRHTVDVEGTTITYGLVLPDHVEHVMLALPPGAQSWPMVEAGLEQWDADLAAHGWAVLSPVANAAPYFEPEGTALVVPFLDAAGAKHGLNTDRVTLFGMSMGGLSAFAVAERSPLRFSSLLAMPGFPTDDAPAALDRLRELPVTMVVGAKDRRWLRDARKARTKLKRAGVAAELIVVPGRGHLVHQAYDWPAFEALLRGGPDSRSSGQPTR